MQPVAAANEQAIEAWNGFLYDRFVKFRDIVTNGFGAYGEAALRCHPPQAGDQALDIGCGFGDTSRRLAELVGPDGSVLGIDAAARFIDTAREEAECSGADNVRFVVGDVEVTDFAERFDYAFSRFGTMFFADPVTALGNVCRALVPGGRLCMVVWRRKVDNVWLHRTEAVVERFTTEPRESDEPRPGPGPFAMADADTTSHILRGAGFRDIELRRCDIDLSMGTDIEQAVEFVMALGSGSDILHQAGDEAERLRPRLQGALAEALGEFAGPDGVRAAGSTWIVGARAPGDPAS